ncbi:MAG TPA: neutral zinc metallopeptidase [Chitinophagaceae bacterium]|jgi:hypothetical protein
MRWAGDRESTNIEDRRGLSGGHIAVGGGIGTLVIGLIIYLLGGNPSQVLNNNPASQVQQTPQSQQLDDEYSKFTRTVLAYTEDVWNKLFSEMNKQYAEPTLVMFTGSTESGCGFASAATGPFYCPSDQKVYIDLSFFDEMKNRFSAGGDFAMAYVIAHEVGHHVQDLLGITRKVDAMRARGSETEGNRLSVKLELQADFLAGVWAHYTEQYKNNLEPGDIEEALNAANAIGDDRLQKESQGYVVPDAFTHGTSEQRMYWFKKGYTTGDISQGDTFNDPGLR